ncbi:ABC transporter substrate-binding protein [Prauserella cavernicola]|uniref:Putative aliphatic sulfonates-binding protein n=1 Tax=Prauserella cavernicola TaxID=2800127 RepID=A0A934QNZ2_9PSEU|nr:ABC transporter substrate-binding protein [Prauserella cavernicola]MBK1783720.1 ABC transporter substrate-binding protein [Prauserella cavernicola]
MTRILRTVLAVVTLAALTACGTGSDSGSGDGVTLTVGQSNKLSSRTLLEAAGLDDTPYDIEWADFNATPDLLEAISAGSVDVGGNGGSTGAIQALYGGKNVKVGSAATAHGSGAESSAIVVPEDSPVRDLSGLKGKKIALTFGAGVHYYTLLALEQFGLSADDVELVNLKTSDGLAAFNSGQVDAWAVWDPILATAQTQSGARPILNSGDITELGETYTFQFVGTEASEDPAKREAIADFLGRVAKAQEWVNDHPEAWAKAGQEVSGLSPEAAELAARRQTKSYVPIGPEVYDTLQREADAWVELGTYDAPVEVSTGFTTRFNDAVSQAVAP